MTGTAGDGRPVGGQIARLVDEHDLLHALTAVRGAVALLARRETSLTSQQRLQLLDVVQEQSSHAMRIVRDACIASRHDRGGEPESNTG